MSTKDTLTLEEQRRRRNRVNRMKTGIMLAIAVWMIVSLIAIIVLSVHIVRLNHRIEELTRPVSSPGSEAVTPEETQADTQADPVDSGAAADTQLNYDEIVTGIDTPENLAVEGDTHRVYLTFNSDPGDNTMDILDVLAEYEVKATFFVTGDESEEMKAVYRRIVEEGHTLGMHSYSNQYSTIYASTDAFLADYEKISGYLEEVTGTKSLYYRFPGGSSNEISNVSMTEFAHILKEKGITWFDWNVSAGDAVSDYTVEDIVANVIDGVSAYRTSVVLLHDGTDRPTTVDALGPMIEALLAEKAQLLPIDEETDVIQYIRADSVG